MILLLALPAAAQTPAPGLPATCTPTSAAAIAETVDDALRSLERLDSAHFVAATDTLDALLPCLSEPMSRHLAAEIHRAKGIRAASSRDPQASRYFAAARSIEPAYKLPSTLIPDGHPVRTLYAEFDVTTGGFEPVPPPAEGAIFLDGSPKPFRPTDWPTIAQYLGGDGSVGFTTYLLPGAPFPTYPTAAAAPVPVPIVGPEPVPAVPVPGPVPELPPAGGSAKVPLGVAAIASGLLTGGLVGLAGLAERDFKDPATPDDELDGLRSRANSLVVAGAFTGAATLGFGVGVLVVR